MNQLCTIEGTVEDIVYSNYANGYTVCVIDAGGDMVTATGHMPYLSEGESVKLSGSWTTHPEYGKQFAASYFEKVLPSTSGAILRYLGSGIVKGIRLAMAKKIVEEFGDDTLTMLGTAPQRLAEIKGISKSKAIEIGNSFAEQQGAQSVVMFLQQYGIKTAVAFKVYRRFGKDAVTHIKDNPYVLAADIDGITFQTADRMAAAMGVEKNNRNRIMAGICYILQYNAYTKGHTFLPMEDLTYTAVNMLGIDIAEAERAVHALCLEKQAYIKTVGGVDAIFQASLYTAETLVAKKLALLCAEKPMFEDDTVDSLIESEEEQMGIQLAPEQKAAVKTALQKGVMVLTGGPGTGKTTIVNAIISIMKREGLSIALCAPTGRAAKRASDLTGMKASTIHRLLEIGYSEGDSSMEFVRDETNTLEEDVIIVDETSMVDIPLASGLLRAIRPDARLIMVGDVDQLPPVGPGNMLGDIIESGTVPVVRLTQIFRQAAESMIVQNAHRIIHGDDPVLNGSDSDFFFVNRISADDIAHTVAELCKKRLPDKYGYDAARQIQVLSAMKKGIAGVKNLNTILQESLNPPQPHKNEKTFGDTIFRRGDKVMHIKNNYSLEWESTVSDETGLGVFNGDMGFIKDVDLLNKKIDVIFDDDRRVVYDFNQIEELELAYAVTVHKSQGSEFDVVVMPMYQAAPMLMRRNLFYTAITRAKKMVVLVGKQASMTVMVSEDGELIRYTGLKAMLANPEG